MEIFEILQFIVGGFVLLIKGADWFVDGASAIAKRFKIPSIVIGLTVVAFGTSLPEASVSIASALQGANEVAVSNVVGSNIFNMLVVLGMSAAILPVAVQKSSATKEIPFSLLCTVVLLGALLLGANTADGKTTYTIGLIAGIVLLALFAFYMFWQISAALKARKAGLIQDEEEETEIMSAGKALGLIGIGIACIIIGGNFVVEGATAAAEMLGMSQTLIGLTIVAVGTSLPELVTSMVAAKKGESDIALGNVVGSNIFNIIFILGFSAVIAPMTVDMMSVFDTIVALGVTVLGGVFAFTKLKVSRWEGITMVLCYVGYMAYIIMREFA